MESKQREEKGQQRECLLADYQELGKIKCHTQTYCVSSSFALSHIHGGDLATARW